MRVGEADGFATVVVTVLDLFLSRVLWLAKLLLLHKWVCFYSESEGEKKCEFQESVMHNIRKQLTGNSVSYLVAKCLHTSKINKLLRLWGELFWVILVFLSWHAFSAEYGFALIWKSQCGGGGGKKDLKPVLKMLFSSQNIDSGCK